MRYIVDISPDIMDFINTLIQKGEYRNVQEFINTSIQNQIYIIEHASTTTLAPEPSRASTSDSKRESTSKSEGLLDLKDYDVNVTDDFVGKTNNQFSGFWNKFLPIKITLRVLANMQQDANAPILLDLLHEQASIEARKLGQVLIRKEKGSGRKRGDRLFTGLPVKRNSDKSRLRFKSHFIGSLSKDKVDGMPGTLRLLLISKGDDGKDYITITKKGLEFSRLKNSIIDNFDYTSTLSGEEVSFLLDEIEEGLPDEFNEMKVVLNLINERKTDAKAITADLLELKPELSKNKLTVFLSGMLNRLNDLKLVKRKFYGSSFIYEVSEKGKQIIKGV